MTWSSIDSIVGNITLTNFHCAIQIHKKGCKPPCAYYKFDVVDMVDATGGEKMGTGNSWLYRVNI